MPSMMPGFVEVIPRAPRDAERFVGVVKEAMEVEG